jgi:hypothetical protein
MLSPGTREIVHQLAGFVVVDDGSDRNLQHDPVAFGSGSVRALAVAPALRLVLRIEAEMHQRVVALAGFHQDIAATPAIAAPKGPPRGHELLPAESQAAVAAVPGYFFLVVFFAGAFFATGFFAAAFLTGAATTSAGASFLTLGAFTAISGAENFWPPKLISAMRTWVKG